MVLTSSCGEHPFDTEYCDTMAMNKGCKYKNECILYKELKEYEKKHPVTYNKEIKCNPGQP